MTGTMEIGDGCLPSSGRRSWVPRTVAAFFLGAGVYAGMSVAAQVAAHADEPAATATQADTAATEEAPATTADPAPAAASEPAAGDTATAASSSPGEASSSSTTVSTTTTTTSSDPAAAGTTTADPGATTAAEPAQTVTTTSTTSTATGTTTVTTTTVTTTSGAEIVTVTTAATAPADPAAATAPQDPSAATTEATRAGPVEAVITQASGNLCDPAGAVSRAGGSRSHVAATTTASAASGADAAGVETPALAVPPGLQAPADAPLAPLTPYQDPTPASAIGLAGCGGPGAGESSPKGTSAPAATGVLGSPFEISLVVNDAGRTAPATESTATTAGDPGSRPD